MWGTLYVIKIVAFGCFLTLFILFQAERDGSNEYSNYQPGSLNND
jgi:hypothetical protein